jgi:hypothetical protein
MKYADCWKNNYQSFNLFDVLIEGHHLQLGFDLGHLLGVHANWLLDRNVRVAQGGASLWKKLEKWNQD